MREARAPAIEIERIDPSPQEALVEINDQSEKLEQQRLEIE